MRFDLRIDAQPRARANETARSSFKLFERLLRVASTPPPPRSPAAYWWSSHRRNHHHRPPGDPFAHDSRNPPDSLSPIRRKSRRISSRSSKLNQPSPFAPSSTPHSAPPPPPRRAPCYDPARRTCNRAPDTSATARRTPPSRSPVPRRGAAADDPAAPYKSPDMAGALGNPFCCGTPRKPRSAPMISASEGFFSNSTDTQIVCPSTTGTRLHDALTFAASGSTRPPAKSPRIFCVSRSIFSSSPPMNGTTLALMSMRCHARIARARNRLHRRHHHSS